MSTKQLHEIQFVDVNHFNLYLFAQRMQLKVGNAEAFEIVEQDYRERYKVSLGDYAWYVEKEELPQFWLTLDRNEFRTIEDKVVNGDILMVPLIPFDKINFTFDENDLFNQTMGIEYLNVETRLAGLVKAAGMTIREIVTMINKEMDEIAKDGNVVKDFDGILTFDTPLGIDFDVKLCFDKVPPVFDGDKGFQIQRTPITPEDLKIYFRDIGPKIQSRLAHINELVTAMFNSKAIANNHFLKEYAGKCITATLVTAFLNQQVNYVTFGGSDNWSNTGKENPNNKACFVYLDQEVDRIFKLLESIPLEEGVDVWSLDIDTFAVFGRKDNKVVTAALQGYTDQILKNLSPGFERILSLRLTMIDSVHIFKG